MLQRWTLRHVTFSFDLNIEVFKYQGKVRPRHQFMPIIIVLYGQTWQLKLYSGFFLFLEVVSWGVGGGRGVGWFCFSFKHTTTFSKNLQYLLFSTADIFLYKLTVLENQFPEANVSEQLPRLWGIVVSCFYMCKVIINCFIIFMARNLNCSFKFWLS